MHMHYEVEIRNAADDEQKIQKKETNTRVTVTNRRRGNDNGGRTS